MTDTTHVPGRNDPCHCGSGSKYKHCCLAKDEAKARTARAKATPKATPAAESAAVPTKTPKRRTDQPWKRSALNTHGFQRMSTPRKVGGG